MLQSEQAYQNPLKGSLDALNIQPSDMSTVPSTNSMEADAWPSSTNNGHFDTDQYSLALQMAAQAALSSGPVVAASDTAPNETTVAANLKAAHSSPAVINAINLTNPQEQPTTPFSARRYSGHGRRSLDFFAATKSIREGTPRMSMPLPMREDSLSADELFNAESRHLYDAGVDVGPATLIEDASGQQYIVRPIRSSVSIELGSSLPNEGSQFGRLSVDSGSGLPQSRTPFSYGSSPPVRFSAPSFYAPSSLSSGHSSFDRHNMLPHDLLEALSGGEAMAQLAAFKAAGGSTGSGGSNISGGGRLTRRSSSGANRIPQHMLSSIPDSAPQPRHNSNKSNSHLATPFGAASQIVRDDTTDASSSPTSSLHARLLSLETNSRPGANSASETLSPSGSLVEPVEVDEWEIDAVDINLGPRVGFGSFGEVYRAEWKETDVAVKRFLEQEVGERVIEEFKQEVAIMKRLRHPNIVQFIGACTHPPNLCIVTQYVARGSLFRLLHRNPTFNPDGRRRLQMALDVAKGMNYLHTCNPPIIHRDLKSPNLLVDKDFTVKVCDFGLSRVRRSAFLTSKTQAGTPEWTAPEVLQSKDSNEKADSYSFGVVLWELLTNKEPWADQSPMQVVGIVGWGHQRLPIPTDITPELQTLMAACFEDAEKRPSFGEIISVLKQQLKALGPPSQA